jgi:MFS family permease
VSEFRRRPLSALIAAHARNGGRLRLLEPLAGRDFALLFSATAVSLLGDGVFYVALAWQTYEISNAAAALSLVMAALFGSKLVFLVIGGVVADRMERRRLMIAADLLRAACLAAISLLALSGRLTLWHLALAVAVYGIGDSLFLPAGRAVLPGLVVPGQLGQANALLAAARPVFGRIAGPALGGLVIGFGSAADGLLLDAATFLASAAILVFVSARPLARVQERRFLHDVLEGLRFVRDEQWLAASLVAAAAGLLFFMGPVNVLLPRLVKVDLHGGALDYGVVFTAGGVGGIAASLLVGQLGLPRRRLPAMYVCWTLGAMGIAAFALASSVWQLFLIQLGIIGALDAGEVIWFTLIQERVPDQLLGRVGALDNFASWALVPVSMALVGPVGDSVGTRPTMAIAGIAAGVIVAATYFCTPALRQERPAEPEPLAPPGKVA